MSMSYEEVFETCIDLVAGQEGVLRLAGAITSSACRAAMQSESRCWSYNGEWQFDQFESIIAFSNQHGRDLIFVFPSTARALAMLHRLEKLARRATTAREYTVIYPGVTGSFYTPQEAATRFMDDLRDIAGDQCLEVQVVDEESREVTTWTIGSQHSSAGVVYVAMAQEDE